MAWFKCIGGGTEPKEEKTLLFTHNNLASWTTYDVSNDVDNILIESTYILHEKKVTERTFLKLSGVAVWPYYDHIAVSSTEILDIGFENNTTIHFRSQNNIAASYNAVTKVYSYKKSGGNAIEDYTTNYFPVLLDSDYYTIFSKDNTNDEIYNGGRGGTRASSDPVFYFCCKTTNDYWGYGLIGLTSASVQITSTTSYGDAVYYTQTTTNGNTVYLAKLGAMISGQSGTIFKNGYFEIDIDGSRYVGQDISTDLFDQTFIDAAYKALIALS